MGNGSWMAEIKFFIIYFERILMKKCVDGTTETGNHLLTFFFVSIDVKFYFLSDKHELLIEQAWAPTSIVNLKLKIPFNPINIFFVIFKKFFLKLCTSHPWSIVNNKISLKVDFTPGTDPTHTPLKYSQYKYLYSLKSWKCLF